MINSIEGTFTESTSKIAIVVSRWNDFITDRLKAGAVDALVRHGVPEENITLVYCPGAYEIPLTTKAVLKTNKYDGVVTLGCVIRGSTPHFDYVCQTVNKGVADLTMNFEKPVSFGILTTDSIEQAIERAGTKAGNKGAEAALTVLEMISLLKKL